MHGNLFDRGPHLVRLRVLPCRRNLAESYHADSLCKPESSRLPLEAPLRQPVDGLRSVAANELPARIRPRRLFPGRRGRRGIIDGHAPSALDVQAEQIKGGIGHGFTSARILPSEAVQPKAGFCYRVATCRKGRLRSDLPNESAG